MTFHHIPVIQLFANEGILKHVGTFTLINKKSQFKKQHVSNIAEVIIHSQKYIYYITI